jgi:hypothetical protein
VYTIRSLKGVTPINSYAIQWRIDVNFIKKVKITADATPTAGVFTVSLEESTTTNRDFALENGTQLFIVAPPIYKGAKTLSTKLKWYLTRWKPDASMLKKGTYYTFL